MNIGEKFYCSRCMRHIDDEDDVCPHCGYDPYDETEKHLLEEGTLLHEGRYQIGAVIGSGGFGITYAAWDRKFDQPVAIKEYYSKKLCERDTTEDDTVTVNRNSEYAYQKGLDRFIREAKILNTLENLKNVVPVIEWFEANNTAYIVMKYIRGVTLEDYVQKNHIQPQKLIAMMRPIIDSLILIHQQGILHRDISPTNIMVQEDGTMILIDFGAAALEEQIEEGKGKTAIFNKRYAPPEQYDESGMQGPWTDVYALSATIYHMICNAPPVESIARTGKDTLKSPDELGIHIKKFQNKAIMEGLMLNPSKRIQSMDIFRSVLYNLPMPEEVIRRRKFMIRVVSAAALFILASVLVMINYSFGFYLGNGIRYSLYGDGLHVRGFSSSNENVNLPSKISGVKVIQIDDGAFQGSENLRDVRVPGSVENISRFAFSACKNLTNVVLDEGVKRISSQAFANCNNLQAVMIPDSIEEIDPDAFSNSSERVVLIGNVNNKAHGLADKLNINYAHIDTMSNDNGITITKYETSQTKASIPDYMEGKPVTVIESGIENTPVFARDITSVILPKNLLKIGDDAFQSTSINSIELPDTLEHIGSTAFNMTQLTSIYLPDSVKYVGMGAFSLTLIETARISPNMKEIPVSCFEACERLREVTIPKGITEIGLQAFRNCSNLLSLNIPEGVRRIYGTAFENCISLEALHLPQSLENIPLSALRGCSNKLMITGLGMTEAKKFCERNGFNFYDLLNKKNFDEKKFYIAFDGSMIIMGYDFEESEEISLPSYGFGVSVKNIRAGIKPSTLKSRHIILSERLEEIHIACFAMNRYLERVTCPDTLRIIGTSAFGECPNLKSIELHEGLTEIGTAAFVSCTSLEDIHLPSSVRNIHAGAFEGCRNLRAITIPSSMVILNDDSFSDTGIISIDIPGNITKCGTSFYGCKSLISAVIHEGVNTLEGTFVECDSLESVMIPSSMKQITHSTFKGCKALRDVWIYSDNVELDAYAFALLHANHKALGEGTRIYLQQNKKLHLFSDCPNVTIHAHKGSSSHQYALKHNIKFEEIPSDREVTLVPQKNFQEDEYWLTKRWEPSENDDDRHLWMKAEFAWGYDRTDFAYRCLDAFAKCKGEYEEYHALWASSAKLFVGQSESHGYKIGQIIAMFENDIPHPVLKPGDIIVECEGHKLDYERINELGRGSGADTWSITILRADDDNVLQKLNVTISKNDPRSFTTEFRQLNPEEN